MAGLAVGGLLVAAGLAPGRRSALASWAWLVGRRRVHGRQGASVGIACHGGHRADHLAGRPPTHRGTTQTETALAAMTMNLLKLHRTRLA